MSQILKNQRRFCQKLQKDEKDHYVDLLKLAPWVRPKVLAIVDSLCSCSFCNSSEFNILEMYDDPHGEIFGVVWASDSLFFWYDVPPTKKAGEKLRVKSIKYFGLDNEQREIVSNFKNWQNQVFQNKKGSLHNQHQPSYYIASRIKHIDGKLAIETITFSY